MDLRSKKPPVIFDEQTPFYKILEQLEKKMRLHERTILFRTGIPRSTYRSWRDGTCEPGKRVYWRKLRDVFKTSWEFLMCGKEEFQSIEPAPVNPNEWIELAKRAYRKHKKAMDEME